MPFIDLVKPFRIKTQGRIFRRVMSEDDML